ncbi:hypothetical protein DAY19_08385 [Halobacteriovorax vibrionivorans]|uniref:Uncharacterized protein n=1 Tax=Halobacteriovorax vibrionivorans TaxID=2152716 RepID=A0ABY0IFG6_9BACT|nr:MULTISPECIES: hypothetical protein [Halobacteriovorax]RZF21696.1 hypothetical protein DAY19_08385 [Halobacteriovorax vibrionivorans]TGD49011.1 hypothetical protein EP118_00655 [Halobacteriovorax sp. Y22]
MNLIYANAALFVFILIGYLFEKGSKKKRNIELLLKVQFFSFYFALFLSLPNLYFNLNIVKMTNLNLLDFSAAILVTLISLLGCFIVEFIDSNYSSLTDLSIIERANLIIIGVGLSISMFYLFNEIIPKKDEWSVLLFYMYIWITDLLISIKLSRTLR